MLLKTRTRGEPAVSNILTYPSTENSEIFVREDNLLLSGPKTQMLPYLEYFASSTITDEVLNLDNLSKTEKKALLASIRDKTSAYYKMFKNVNNNVNYFYTTVYPSELNGRIYPFIWSKNYYSYSNASTYSYYSWNYGGAMVNPIDTILSSSELASLTGVNSFDMSEFLSAAAEDAALLGLESFSIANFIAELRDVKQLVDVLKFDFSSLLTSSAKQNLAWQFGVLPFIGDVVKLINIIVNLDKRIQFWNDMAASQVTMNQHRSVKSDKPTSMLINRDWSTVVRNRISFDVDFVTRYHIYYTADPLPPLLEDNLLRAMLGLDNIGSIIWEAIPFSFMIDYVYNIGDIIEHYTNSDPVLSISIREVGYSRKLELTNVHQRVDNVGNLTTKKNLVPAFEREGGYSGYERSRVSAGTLPVIPEKTIGEFTIKDFNGQKASIVASIGLLFRK